MTIQLTYFIGFLILVYQLTDLAFTIPPFSEAARQLWAWIAHHPAQLMCFWIGSGLGQASHLRCLWDFPHPTQEETKATSMKVSFTQLIGGDTNISRALS